MGSLVSKLKRKRSRKTVDTRTRLERNNPRNCDSTLSLPNDLVVVSSFPEPTTSTFEPRERRASESEVTTDEPRRKPLKSTHWTQCLFRYLLVFLLFCSSFASSSIRPFLLLFLPLLLLLPLLLSPPPRPPRRPLLPHHLYFQPPSIIMIIVIISVVILLFENREYHCLQVNNLARYRNVDKTMMITIVGLIRRMIIIISKYN